MHGESKLLLTAAEFGSQQSFSVLLKRVTKQQMVSVNALKCSNLIINWYSINWCISIVDVLVITSKSLLPLLGNVQRVTYYHSSYKFVFL